MEPTLKIDRVFQNLSANPFSLPKINALIVRYLDKGGEWIDPFVNDSCIKNRMWKTNDINPKYLADAHMDAVEFLQTFKSRSVQGVLLDPPYSPRQIKECYDSIGIPVTGEDTRSDFWSKIKDEAERIVKANGYVISLGWNSNGMGKCRHFTTVQILLCHHGGQHNDTIVVIDQKSNSLDACIGLLEPDPKRQ
jgi:hypothetical protein